MATYSSAISISGSRTNVTVNNAGAAKTSLYEHGPSLVSSYSIVEVQGFILTAPGVAASITGAQGNGFQLEFWDSINNLWKVMQSWVAVSSVSSTGRIGFFDQASLDFFLQCGRIADPGSIPSTFDADILFPAMKIYPGERLTWQNNTGFSITGGGSMQAVVMANRFFPAA